MFNLFAVLQLPKLFTKSCIKGYWLNLKQWGFKVKPGNDVNGGSAVQIASGFTVGTPTVFNLH